MNARAAWDAAAAGWDRDYAWYAASVRPLTQWICDAVAAPGARVLDVACGTGQPSLELAARVGPGGRVVATDLAPRMLDALRRRAAAAGLDNLDARQMDAEELQLDGGCFDAVTCACGVMFCADPVAALAGMRRVLVPGGRIAIAVWDEPARSPFFAVVGAVLRSIVPAPPRPVPLAAPGELARALRAAGFEDVEVHACALTFELASADEYWDRFVAFAAGVADQLGAVPAADLQRARAALRDATAPFVVNGRLRLPATALCGAARAP